MEHLKFSLKKTNQKIYLSAKDHFLTGEDFDLLLNEELEMLVTDPQPSSEELIKYYDSAEYVSHSDSKKGLINRLYQAVKKRALTKKIRLINRLAGQRGTLLDVGAGTGDFLQMGLKQGWTVQGVEPNLKARELSKAKNIFSVESLKEISEMQFDVITLWHVLEHLPNLEESVSEINNLLKPGGILVVAVPNYRSYDARYYKSYWAAYDLPRHLWHFSRSSLPKLFSGKFNLVETHPMIYDSFYVSLLSEKYINGRSGFFRAFCVGLWSNIRAWRTREYSSLIYCFSKAD